MPRPEISVLIPAYNVGNYIVGTLESLSKQTLGDFEIVFVDDGSTDRTAELAGQLLNDFRFTFKLIRQENRGVSVARNVAIENASGRYLKFLDADDMLTPDALELLVRRADETKCAIVSGKQDLVSASGKVIFSHDSLYEHPHGELGYQEAIKGFLLGRYLFPLNASLISRELVEKYRLRFTKGAIYMEDFEFMAKAIFYARTLALLDCTIALALYRESSTTKKPSLSLFHNVASVQRLATFFERNGELGLSLFIREKVVPWMFAWTIGGLAYNGCGFRKWRRLLAVPIIKHNLDRYAHSLAPETRFQKRLVLLKLLYKLSPSIMYLVLRLAGAWHKRK